MDTTFLRSLARKRRKEEEMTGPGGRLREGLKLWWWSQSAFHNFQPVNKVRVCFGNFLLWARLPVQERAWVKCLFSSTFCV